MIAIVAIPLLLWCICLVLGITFRNLSGKPSDRHLFVTGLIVFFASFYLFATPFMLLGWNIRYLLLALTVFYGICFCFAVPVTLKYLRKNKKRITGQLRTFAADRYHLLLFLLFLVMIVWQISYVVLFQHTDIDDSYYLAQANTFAFTGSVGTVEPSSGLAGFSASNQYALVSFEILYALIHNVFGVNIAFLAHTVWPVFAIVCHYAVIRAIARKVSRSLHLEFCLLYSIINLYGGSTIYGSGSFLLQRIWQGKSFFVAIFLPIMILAFLELSEKISFREVVFLWLILLAGFGTTTVAVYLYPILYFCLWAGKSISERKFRSSAMLCLPVLGVLPWVLTKLVLIYTGSADTVSVQEQVTEGVDTLSYFDQLFTRFLNSRGIFLIGFIAALLIVLLFSRKRIRQVIVYPTLILFLTFANPAAITPVAQLVTGTAVYWRIFWLLHIPLTMVIAMILLAEKCVSNRERVLAVSVAATLIFSCGSSVFENGTWELRENPYKLDSRSVQIADAIHADVGTDSSKTLFLPEEISYGIREYCGDIATFINRYSSGTFEVNKKAAEYSSLQTQLYTPLYEDCHWDAAQIKQQMQSSGIDYLVLYTRTLPENTLPESFTCIWQNDEFSLFRCSQSQD